MRLLLLLLLLVACSPKEIPRSPADNLHCRCEGLHDFFIRGNLRSSIRLGGGNVVVMGDVECTLHCVVDPIEAEQ